MSRRQQGWTLIEVMVSTAILVLLMVMMAEALGTTQRSWMTSRSAAASQQTLDAATGMISMDLQQAALQTRSGYDTNLNQTVPASDLHFVCGPAAELLPALAGACGDAIFFQRPAADLSTGLRQALQCRGFFVQYGGDEAWRPAFSSTIPARRRFRLLQFHQPVSALALFQTSGTAGAPPLLGQMTSRAQLYGWFSQPLAASGSYQSSVSVIAENVVAMIVQTTPAAQRCYDTRRQQWEPGSAAATLSRNQLPQMVEATLVLTDEASWASLSMDQADAFAGKVQSLVQGLPWLPAVMPQNLDALKQMLVANGMKVKFAVISVPMCD